MDRVSTVNLNSMSIGGALKAQSQWANAQMQQSSGLVSEDFAGLGGQGTSRMLSLSKDIEQAQTWASEAKVAESKTEAMYSALGSSVTVVNKLQTLISSATSNPTDTSLLSQVETLQESLVAAINTKLNGVYLFAGSNTDTAPVSLTGYPSSLPYDPTAVDTSYYSGDDTINSVRVSAQQTISYGVTGDIAGFEEALRSLEAFKQTVTDLQAGTITESQAVTGYGQALTIANQAVKDLANTQAVVSANATALTNVSTQQTTYVTYLQNSLSDVKNVDAAEVAARVATLQTQLTASYSAVSNIAKMSLAQYI